VYYLSITYNYTSFENEAVMIFFEPIYGNSEAPEKLSFLRPATTLFNFGQKTYQIEVLDSCMYLVEGKNKPGLVGIALRVALIMTVVVPLIAMAAIAIYRAANKFYEKNYLNYFAMVPLEVLEKHIFRYALLDVPALSKTCKQFQASVTPRAFIKAAALNQCLRVAPLIDMYAPNAFCEIALQMVPYHKGRAREILNEASKHAGGQLGAIRDCYVKFDFEKALEISPNLSQAMIDELIKIDPESKAREFLQIAERKNLPDIANLCRIAICLNESRLADALAIADLLPIDHQLDVIVKIIEFLPQDEALARSEHVLQLVEPKPEHQKNPIISELIRVCFAKYDLERAKELVPREYYMTFVHIAREFAKSNLEEAINWALGLGKLDVLMAIAESVYKTHPERAREIIEMGTDVKYQMLYVNNQFELVAGAMVLVDEERALQIADLAIIDPYKYLARVAVLKRTASLNLARDIFKKYMCTNFPDMYFYKYQRFDGFLNIAKSF